MRHIPPMGGVETVSLEVLEEQMPDACFDVYSPYKREPFDSPEAHDRLLAAGVGLVDVTEEGECHQAYYAICPSPQLRILDIVCDFENAEGLWPGTVKLELRSIAQGTFDEAWSAWIDYFARQQG